MSVVNEQSVGLTIKTVAERTGVSVHTLRAWERRYGVPLPRRVPGNRYRVYSEEDIADVLAMKRQIDAGVSPVLASQALAKTHVVSSAAGPGQEQPLAGLQAALQTALLKSDEGTARGILDEAIALFTLEQVTLEIIQPTMAEIGERWMRNEVAVWQEHLATNIVRQKLLAVLHSQPVPPLSVPYLVSVCAPAEEHEIGLLIFSLFARRHGWRVAYLGQGTPLTAVVDLAHRSNPICVVISVTTVAGLASMIAWLESENRPEVRLAFGGRLLNQVPALRNHLPGAFLGEDAVTGVRNLGTMESPKELWSPGRRALGAAQALQAKRLKIAGDTVAQFMAKLPARIQPKWSAQDLSFATFFLLDVLACALAFDAPEVIDLQRTWLTETLSPRGVMPALIGMHLDTVARVLADVLDPGDAGQFKALLARMETSTRDIRG